MSCADISLPRPVLIARIKNVPKGPRGEKRPADAVARAIMVAKIATGEVEETGLSTGVEARQGMGRKLVDSTPAQDRPAYAKKVAKARCGHD